MPIRKLVIVGVGLIGGSCALALKAAGAVERVVGTGRNPASLDEALRLGVIDEASTALPEAVADADLVLLAVPVAQTGPLLARMADALPDDCVVTDAGSTKSDVVAAAREALGPRIGQFVPGHPIAGAERSGVAAARVDLYRGRRVVLTPLPENAPEAVDRVADAWRACGALVTEMPAERHDAVFAAVSHLPHLLAFTLVAEVAGRDNAGQLFDFAASGFRDFTRIAGSSPEMWRDIFLANREALLAEAGAYARRLEELASLVAAGDGAALERVLAEARSARQAWMERIEAGENRQ